MENSKNQSLKLFCKHIASKRWEFSRGLLMLNSEQIHEVLKGICKEESAKSNHPSYAYEHKLKDNLFIYVKRKKGL